MIAAAAMALAWPVAAEESAPGCVATGDVGASNPKAAASALIPPNKRTKAGLYLSAYDAGPMLAEHAAKVLFVDVRTRGELMFAGMPAAVDAHVPYMFDPDGSKFDAERGAFVLTVNPDFVTRIDRLLAAKGLTRADPVVLICQGGVRAAKAADLLADAGFAQPWIIVDGFEGDPATEGPAKGLRTVNGWRNAGLAWTTKLDAAKMYGTR
jgi:rhodanese-related sulfurtransferase